MKKNMTAVEVKLFNLSANNVIATSMRACNEVGNGTQLVGGRDYYDEEEW